MSASQRIVVFDLFGVIALHHDQRPVVLVPSTTGEPAAVDHDKHGQSLLAEVPVKAGRRVHVEEEAVLSTRGPLPRHFTSTCAVSGRLAEESPIIRA